MEKALLFFIAFFLLHNVVYPARDVPLSSCSSNFEDELYRHNESNLHFVLHHPLSPCSPSFVSFSFSLSTLLSHDHARANAIADRLTSKAQRHPKHHHHHHAPLPSSSPFSSPLSSGTVIGVGNYVTRISLGTPSKSYVMVVDTGSSLTWLQCTPCRVSCHAQVGSIFNPSLSTTYRAVSCSSEACNGLQSATLNPSACSTSNICIYQASYGDNSFSVGYLSTDTLFLGSKQSFSNFVYGCGQDNEGLFGKSAGLIGLARNKLSLLSQLSSKLGYNSFTYCLPTTKSTGYLSIGSYNPSEFGFTPIVSSSLDNSLYFVKLVGITVGRKMLKVSSTAYTSVPTIMDSGTVITRLPLNVYNALSNAMVSAMKRYRRASAYSILDTCFKGSLSSLMVPQVTMIFDGGATMKLETKNVLIDIDDATTCLAFASTERVAIIGNRQQQTFKVVYDVGNSKIGFAAGGCG